MNLIENSIKTINDSRPNSSEITKSEILSTLEKHALSLNVNTGGLEESNENDVFIKTFSNNLTNFPDKMRNRFYKMQQWENSSIKDFILFNCKLFFECFVLFYDILLPTQWDPNSKQATNLLGLFLDFLLLLNLSKKKVKEIVLIFSKLDSGKSSCLSNRLEQLDILECKDKLQICQLYNKNCAFQHIFNNYKSVFQNHPQFDKITELVDQFLAFEIHQYF